MMLTKELDLETERYLAEILVQEDLTSEELIKNLIRDRWLSLRSQPLVDSPAPGLNEPDLSQSDSTKSDSPKQRSPKRAIAEFVRKKHSR
jgi:hypothetical protein